MAKSNETTLIDLLKKNRYAFGMWTDPECYGPEIGKEMQEKALEIGNDNFHYYTSDRKWEPYPSGDFYDDQACCLRPDYEEEPEIVECEIEECEIKREGGTGNFVYRRDGHIIKSLHRAIDDPDFIGFKFEDGGWYNAPIKPVGPDGKLWSGNITVDDIVSGRVKILDASHVLFRRQK